MYKLEVKEYKQEDKTSKGHTEAPVERGKKDKHRRKIIKDVKGKEGPRDEEVYLQC